MAGEKQTVQEALIKGSQSLRGKSDSPFLDAALLLGHTLKMGKEKLFASYPEPLSQRASWEFANLVNRRLEGFPIAYLLGKKEFYGRPFLVTQGVLCPRPETEILVEVALREMDQRDYRRVHDLCTGTGCVGLTIALEKECARVSASDISSASERAFQSNCGALGIPLPLTKPLFWRGYPTR